jgi:hypothetical protein
VDVWCDLTESGYCQCSSNREEYGIYDLAFDSETDTCNIAASLCLNSSLLTFAETDACEPTSSYVSKDGSCFLDYLCARALMVDGEVVGNQNVYRSAYCELQKDSYRCNYDGPNDLTTSLELAADIEEPCSVTWDLGETETFVPTGSMECSPESVQNDLTYCDGTLNCKQTGTIGDVEATQHYYAYTFCKLTNDSEQWDCSCDKEEAAYTINGASGWEACSDAIVRCGESIVESATTD